MKTAANWVRYTPEIARTILDGHINIRVVNIPHVGYLAGEMAVFSCLLIVALIALAVWA